MAFGQSSLKDPSSTDVVLTTPTIVSSRHLLTGLILLLAYEISENRNSLCDFFSHLLMLASGSEWLNELSTHSLHNEELSTLIKDTGVQMNEYLHR